MALAHRIRARTHRDVREPPSQVADLERRLASPPGEDRPVAGRFFKTPGAVPCDVPVALRRPAFCTGSRTLGDTVADREGCMTKKSFNWLTLGCLVALGATAAYAGDPRMRRLVVV